MQSVKVPWSNLPFDYRLHRSGGRSEVFPTRSPTWRGTFGAGRHRGRCRTSWTRRRSLRSAALTPWSFAANPSAAGNHTLFVFRPSFLF